MNFFLSLLRAPRFLFLLGVWIFLAVGPAAAQDTTGNAGSADALYYDATKARLKGDEAVAQGLLEQVIRLKPKEAAPYYDLSRLLARSRTPEKALEYARTAVQLAPDNQWYQRQLADVLTARARYAEAAEVYAGLAARPGTRDPEPAIKAAFLFQRASKYKEAIAALDRAAALQPGDADILLQKQQLYLKLNDVEGAVRTVREVIAANPRDARYYALLADLYANNKQPEKAAEVYTEAEKKFPGDPIIQLALAQQARDAKDTARYNAYVKRAITNRELSPEAQIKLLIPYLQEISRDTARRDEGLRLAASVAEQHQSNAGVQSFYGEILQLFGRSAEASEQFKKAVVLDGSQFDYWRLLLNSYLDPGSADSLVVWSEKAAKLYPTQAIVHFFNGVGQLSRKAYPQAIRAINRAIDIQPEEDRELLASMYTTLGDAYNSAKQYTESDSAYEAAMRLDPRNATLLNNYAYYLSVRGVRLDDAERMSKRSLELRQDEGTFLDTYGWILYKQGKYRDALDYIQRAVDAAGDRADGTLWDHLGDALYRTGERDKAVDAWKQAQQRKADNPLLEKKISERKLYE